MLVVAIVGTGAALINGVGPLAAAIGIGVGLLVIGLMPWPGAPDVATTTCDTRQAGEPFSWEVTAPPGISLSAASERLQSFGFSLDLQGPSQVCLSAGSQLWTRLLGGYFVNPARLPIKVALEGPLRCWRPGRYEGPRRPGTRCRA